MANYFEAAYPEPYQVLGVRLLPFSFGHYLKLHRLGCGFVAEESAQPSIGDLLLGVICCSMRSHPDPEQDPFWVWLHKEQPDGFWARLWWRLARKKVTPAEAEVVRWGKQVGVFDLSEKAELFNRYVKDGSKIPPYVEEPSDTPPRPSGSHWAQSVIDALVAKCGYTQLEAYNAPMSKAWADFLKHAETEGAIRLLPSEVVEAMA